MALQALQQQSQTLAPLTSPVTSFPEFSGEKISYSVIIVINVLVIFTVINIMTLLTATIVINF